MAKSFYELDQLVETTRSNTSSYTTQAPSNSKEAVALATNRATEVMSLLEQARANTMPKTTPAKRPVYTSPLERQLQESRKRLDEIDSLGDPRTAAGRRSKELENYNSLLSQLAQYDPDKAKQYSGGFGQRLESTLRGGLGSSAADTIYGLGTLLGPNEDTKQRLENDLGKQYQGERIQQFNERVAEKTESAQRKLSEGIKSTAREMHEGASANIEGAKAGANALGRFAVDAGVGAIGLAGDMLSPVGAMTSLAAKSFGGAAREAEEAGASNTEAVMTGVAKTLLATQVEKLMGGALGKVYGKGAADDAVEQLIGKLAKTDGGRTIVRYLSNAVGEGAEEFVEGALQPVLNSIYDKGESLKNKYSSWENWSAELADNLYSALIGTAIGGVAGAGNIITGGNRQANAELRAAEEAEREAIPQKRLEYMQEQNRYLGMEKAGIIKEVPAKFRKSVDEVYPLPEGMSDISPTATKAAEPVTGKAVASTRGEVSGYSGNIRAAKDLSAQVGGKKVQVVSVSERDGELMLHFSDGQNNIKTVPANEAELTADTEALISAVRQYGESAPAMFAGYQPGQDIRSYVQGWYVAEQIYGKQSNVSDVSKLQQRNDPLLKVLTSQQLTAAFNNGRRLRETEQQKAKAAAVVSNNISVDLNNTEVNSDNALGNADNALDNSDNGTNRSVMPAAGNVSLEGGTVNGRTYAAVDQSKLTKKQKKQIEAVGMLAEKTGINFIFYESKLDKSGHYIGENGLYVNGTIYIDVNAGKRGRSIGNVAIVRTAAHELTHYMQEHSPERYEELKSFMLDKLLEWQGKSLGDLMLEKMQRDSSGELTMNEALDEVIADGCEMMLRRTTIMQQMAQENKGLFSDIKAWLDKWLSTLREAFKGVSAVHEEALAMVKHMEQLQELWDKGLADAAQNTQQFDTSAAKENAAPEDGKARMSLREFPDGRKYVEVDTDQDIFDGLSLEQMQSKAKKIILERFANKVIGSINRVYVNRVGANEYGYPAKFLKDPEIKEAKMRASTELDNLIDAGTNFRSEPDGRDGHVHPNAEKDFTYFDTIFKVGNEYFSGVINILNNKKGALFKDLTKIENITEDIISSYGINPQAEFLSDISTNSIFQTEEKINTKLSERDFLPDDRELLLEAASRKGAGESLISYRKKYEQLEALNRKLGRQQTALAAAAPEARAELKAKVDSTEQQIEKAENALERMEAGAMLQAEANKLRAEWRDANPDEAAKSIRSLQEENESLKQYLEYWKKRNSLTERGKETVLPEDIRKLAKALLDEHGSNLAQNYLEERLQALGDFIVSDGNGEGLDYRDLRKQAAAIARDIIDEAYVEENSNEQLRNDIRNYLRSTKLKISDELRGETDVDYFRKHNMGTLRLGNDGRDIDSAYAEMADMFGEGLFPLDITAHYDQLEQMLSVLEKLRPTYHQMYSRYERNEVVGLLANEIIDRLISGDVRQYESEADKAYSKMAQEVIGSRKSEAEQKAEIKSAVDKARQRAEERAQMRQTRINIDRTAARLRKALTENSAKRHIPEAMKESIGNFLLGIDSAPKAGTKAYYEYIDQVRKLAEIVAKQQKMQADTDEDGNDYYLDLPDGIAEEISQHIETVKELTESGQEWKLSTMSLAELERLEMIINSLSSSVTSVNELLAGSIYKEVDAAASDSLGFLKSIRGLKGERQLMESLRSFLGWSNTLPVYAFKRFGPGGEAIFKEIQKGWGKLAMNSKQVLEFAEKAYTTQQAVEAENTVHTFKLQKRLLSDEQVDPDFDSMSSETSSGENYNSKGDGAELRSDEAETVTMTTAQVMSLYGLIKREQARGHILGAGIRISDYKLKGKETTHQTDNYLLTMEDVYEITSVLTDEQIKIVDELMEFMNTVGSEWGNEISMKRFGIRGFTEENYFPIKTDSRSRQQQAPEGQRGGLYRLLNMSFTKNTVRNASNAVVIESVFDVFSNHMADMAKYNALSLPILDAMKWYNYNVKSQTNKEGQYTTSNLRKELERVYGTQAQNYFVSFMQDLNGMTEGGRGESALKKMVSNYKVAAVGANLRVALQQPTSIMRARLHLDGKYLAQGMAMSGGHEKALKYSGIANWKDMGYYDTNINRGLREKIKHTETATDVLREKSMILAAKGDAWTLGALWNACELEVKDKQKLSGEALMEATAERFDEVVMLTQVIDSTISRSHNMRSTSLAMSEVTAFMSEPTLTFNTVLDSAVDYLLDARRTNKSEAWKKHRGKVAKTMYVYVLSSALTAVFAAIADAARDDDEYQNAVEKWLEHFWSNFISNANPLNLLPVVSTVKDILVTGDTKESMIFEPVQRAKKAMDIFVETWKLARGTLDEPTEVTYYGNMTNWGRVYNYLTAVGTLAGLPLGSLSREVSTLWNSTFGGWLNMKLKTYDAGPKGNIKQAFVDGYLEESEAVKLLLDEGIVDGEDDALRMVYEWGLDGTGKYDAVLDAVLENNSAAFDTAKAELVEYGYSEKSIVSEVKSSAKSWYMGNSEEGQKISKQQTVSILKTYCGVSAEEAAETVQKWTCYVVEGIYYDNVDTAYIDGDIDSTNAKRMLKTYGGLSEADADARVLQWQCEKDTGVSYYDLNSAYEGGRITATELVDYRAKYGNSSTYKEAQDNYTNYGAPAEISKDVYYKSWIDLYGLKSDKDAEGNTIKYSLQNKRWAYINSLKLSRAQKDALHCTFYAASTLDEAPWNNQ